MNKYSNMSIGGIEIFSKHNNPHNYEYYVCPTCVYRRQLLKNTNWTKWKCGHYTDWHNQI